MRRGIIFCCLAFAGLWGCTSTYELWDQPPEAASRRLRSLQGKTVDLALKNGFNHENVTVNFFGDSVGFQREDPPIADIVPITSVVSLSKSGSAWGAIFGLLGGMFLGGGIGGAIGAASQPEPRNHWEAINNAAPSPYRGTYVAVAGGLIGGAVGLVIGAVAGSGEKYFLSQGPFSGTPSYSAQRCLVCERRNSGDTVTLGFARLIKETPTKVTLSWRGTEVSVIIPPAELTKKQGWIILIVPENVLN